MEVITSAVVEYAFSELKKTFLEVIKTIAVFKSTFKRLEATMDAISEIFLDIQKKDKMLDRPQHEVDFFVDQMRKGTDLIRLCSKIKSWDLYKKYVYSKMLESFNESLNKFFQINVQAHQFRAIKQVSLDVYNLGDNLSDKFDILKEILDDVREKVDSIKLNSTSSSVRSYTGSAYVGEIPELVLGLDLSLEEVKVKLLKDNVVQTNEGLSLHLPTVVLVSALPGCGKTTLANMVCLDSIIKEKFKENILFVTVSKAVNIGVIVKAIFKQKECLDGVLEVQNDEDAINQLRQKMKQIGGPIDNPILLVLDDVWSPGLEPLIQKFMFKGIPGYKILVTSRFTSDVHQNVELQFLSHDNAKRLFCHSAFPPGNKNPVVSDETVNKVVKACNRLPLALNVVGLSLHGKPEAVWKRTLDTWSKGRSTIFDSNTDLLNTLKTSLDALDEEKGKEKLKDGFLDLGSFPEDQRISATVLLDIWVELYEFDEDGLYTYTNLLELSTRNLLNIVPTRKDDSFDLAHCYCNGLLISQHDMLRELAIHQCRQEDIELRNKLIIEITGEGHPKDWVRMLKQPLAARLVSISTDDTFISKWSNLQLPEAEVLILNFRSKKYNLPHFMEHMNKLKVLIVSNYGFSAAELDNFPVVGYLSSLRRIRLEHVSISSPFSSTYVFQLINLQKLSLTMCDIGNALDNCANMFPNLVEIEMEYCRTLVELPKGICDIVSLSHISITSCNQLHVLPEEIGRLTNLQSLRLNSCTGLQGLPETIGGLEKLNLLDISDCLSLIEMPIQIGDLRGLRTLNMRGCWGLDELPTSVEDLKNLTVFCDSHTASLWEYYKEKVAVVLVKEDINLNWLNK